jgi:hypothetical protein
VRRKASQFSVARAILGGLADYGGRRLHHMGWNFDINGNSLGTFTLDEKNTVGPHGKAYQGTFDLKFYNVNGNLIQEVTGTQTATQITVN